MKAALFLVTIGMLLTAHPSTSAAQSGSALQCIGWNDDSPAYVPYPGGPQLESSAAQIVKDIVTVVGRVDTIKVSAVQMDGACADTGEQGHRLIIFGAAWLEKYSAGNSWVRLGILAHEVGHHLNDHKPSRSDVWRQEYEADMFLGRVVRLLGGSLQDALAVSASEPDTGHQHPFREVRELAITKGYQGESGGSALSDVQVTAGAIRALDDLNGDRARRLLERAERLFRSGTADAADGRLLAQAIISHVDPIVSQPNSDAEIAEFVRVLNAIPAEWWGRQDWSEQKEYAVQALSFIDSAISRGANVLSAQTAPRFNELSRKIGFFVPPDRLVSAGPFRARMDYCALRTCTVTFVLHGYDVRGNLRYDSSETISEMSSGSYRDTVLGSQDRLYFNPSEVSMEVVPLKFSFFCVFEGQVVEGNSTSVEWNATFEASGAYATWLFCDSPRMRASIGIGVNPAVTRQHEPPVKTAPAPIVSSTNSTTSESEL